MTNSLKHIVFRGVVNIIGFLLIVVTVWLVVNLVLNYFSENSNNLQEIDRLKFELAERADVIDELSTAFTQAEAHTEKIKEIALREMLESRKRRVELESESAARIKAIEDFEKTRAALVAAENALLDITRGQSDPVLEGEINISLEKVSGDSIHEFEPFRLDLPVQRSTAELISVGLQQAVLRKKQIDILQTHNAELDAILSIRDDQIESFEFESRLTDALITNYDNERLISKELIAEQSTRLSQKKELTQRLENELTRQRRRPRWVIGAGVGYDPFQQRVYPTIGVYWGFPIN